MGSRNGLGKCRTWGNLALFGGTFFLKFRSRTLRRLQGPAGGRGPKPPTVGPTQKHQGPWTMFSLGIILGHHLGAEFLKANCPKGSLLSMPVRSVKHLSVLRRRKWIKGSVDGYQSFGLEETMQLVLVGLELEDMPETGYA